jgi:general secretion pathway protein L
MPLDSATPAAASATWIALAPHDMAHGSWRVVDSAGKSDTYTSGTLAAAVSHRGRTGNDTSVCASICVIAPLSRCIVMATDLPLLTGPRLQLALTGALGDRLSNSGVQHYAAAPVENGRIREAAVCDAQWLRQCLGALAESGVRVARVVPEAALLPKGSAGWGQLQADQPPAWLVRAASGEAVRVAPPLLDAVLPPAGDAMKNPWQCFADPACAAPPAREGVHVTPLAAAALLRRGVQTAKDGWDLRQFSFAPPDGAARVLQWGAEMLHQRNGRFALGALLLLLAVNVLGLNLYAMKQRHEIRERHAEMERIVAQALPGAPRVLEPALQLEAAWQRVSGGAAASSAGTLLALFAQSGSAPSLTALDVSDRALRAGFSNATALERAVAACQAATTQEILRRAGASCVRDNEQLLLEFAGGDARKGKGKN